MKFATIVFVVLLGAGAATATCDCYDLAERTGLDAAKQRAADIVAAGSLSAFREALPPTSPLARSAAAAADAAVDPTPPGYPPSFHTSHFILFTYKPDPSEDFCAQGQTLHDDTEGQLRSDLETCYFAGNGERDFTSSKVINPPMVYDMYAPGVGLIGAPLACTAYEAFPGWEEPDNFEYFGVEFVGSTACDLWINFNPNSNATQQVWMDFRNGEPRALMNESPLDHVLFVFDDDEMAVGAIPEEEFEVPDRIGCTRLHHDDVADAAAAGVRGAGGAAAPVHTDPTLALYATIRAFNTRARR